MSVLNVLLVPIWNIVADRVEFAAENLAHQEQFATLEQRCRQQRPRTSNWIFWVILSRT